jgi:acetyl-CoA carboxylase biotin carboxyl carrier protein
MTQVHAPITGRVWKIERRAGDRVAAGDPVVILESMKMEVPVEAPADGVVRSVAVTEGEAVEEGAVVATLDRDD